MPALSDGPTPGPGADSVTLDDYFGRVPSVVTSATRAPWPYTEQLTSRYGWYRYMREHNPVALDPQTGIWSIFRYSDVHRALTDVADFSNVLPGKPEDDPMTSTMLRVDLPRHRELRNLVNQAFTSRRVVGLRERVQSLSDELVTGAAKDGHVDVAMSIAQVLPTLVIGSLLGIDLSLTHDFRRWTDAFMRSVVNGPDAEQSALLAEMDQYFDHIIEQRRREQGDDLISAVVHAEADGAHLTNRDVLQFCKLLLIAGSETTTHLITNTVLCLQQRPDLMEGARRDPARVRAVIEEVLRYLAPIQAAPRRARREIRLYDQVIPAGAMVHPWLGSANRDPEEFPDPDVFSLDRAQGKHISFGYGIHFCVGASLARLETEVVVTTMLSEFAGAWTIPKMLPIYPAHQMCGLNSLPLTWS
ncbi:MAG: cytochrome P450 [Actinoallomurus sp.]